MKSKLLLCVLLCLCVGIKQSFATDVATEMQLKTRYVFNFPKFTAWPLPRPQPTHLCLLGQNPLIQQIEEQAKQQAAKVSSISQIAELDHCQVLFLSPQDRSQLEQWLNELNKRPVLTVSDYIDSSAIGVMIELVTHTNRIGFRINRSKVKEAGLSMHSDMLFLAEEVR